MVTYYGLLDMLKVHPGPARGRLAASPSKSATHRAFLIGAIADGEVEIDAPLLSADTQASLDAAAAFGCRVEVTPGPTEGDPPGVRISRSNDVTVETRIECGNSGTTLRLATGIAAARSTPTHLDGDASLRSRPMLELLRSLEAAGVTVESRDGHAPLTLCGPLRTRELTVDGGQSSQFVSALVLALVADGQGGSLRVDGTPVSRPYLDLTLRALTRAGIKISQEPLAHGGLVIRVAPGPPPRPGRTRIDGDWSSAAFPLCAGALSGAVRVTGLPAPATQADGALVDFLRAMGSPVTGDVLDPEMSGLGSVSVEAAELRGIEADLAACPDLFPVLAVTLAQANGPSRLYGAPHLRGKETDRIDLVVRNLRRHGVTVTENEDGVELPGGARLSGGAVETGGDHRILMAFAVGATTAAAPVTYDDPDPQSVVAISYPDFLRDMKTLGVRMAER